MWILKFADFIRLCIGNRIISRAVNTQIFKKLKASAARTAIHAFLQAASMLSLLTFLQQLKKVSKESRSPLKFLTT
jgi:hypothetical protein